MLRQMIRAQLLAGIAVFAPLSAFAQTTPAATTDPAVVPPPAATPVSGKRVYTPADFARFAPKTAFDMLRQVPGFTINQADQERGLGQASENVLLNGQRVSSKSGGAIGELQKIAASNVERIEIVDATTLEIAGLSGQVANVIAKTKSGGGQFSWRPETRAHYTDSIYTRGDISYSGSRGPVEYTIGLNSGGNRSGAGGPTTIFNRDDRPFEYREDEWRSNFNNPKLTGRLTVSGGGPSIGNLNLSYMPFWQDFREVSRRDRVDGVDRTRSSRFKLKGFNYEVGGDYSFGLGPGTLKLIGLRKFEREPFTSTAIYEFADGSADAGDRFKRDGKASEWIGRGEYSWKAGRSDFQISAEAAYNTLNSVTRLFQLGSDGAFEEIDFPGGTGSVEEDRYEALGTWSRPLSETLSMQFVAGGEYSKLTSSSDLAILTRSFFRPKGSLSLAWKPSDDFDLSLKLRRRVGQLDFYDFLASVNLTEDRQNAGNLNLIPPQSWEVDLEGNRKLGDWGTTKLRLYGRRIDDIVDIIPIGASGQSPGNIDRAVRYGVESRSTLLFDPIGWRGAKLDMGLTLQRSRLKDPLTGESRPISNSLERQIELRLRHDIPGSNWAWGGSLYHERSSYSYRLTEVGRMWEGPVWLGAFVENKDVFGTTVEASVGNLLNARSRWDRTVYSGFRNTSPVLFREHRNRLIGPIFSLSVRGNF